MPRLRIGKQTIEYVLFVFAILSVGFALGATLSVLLEPQRVVVKPVPAPALAPAPVLPHWRYKIVNVCPSVPEKPAVGSTIEAAAPIAPPSPPVVPKILNMTPEPVPAAAPPAATRHPGNARHLRCVTAPMRRLWDQIVARYGDLEIIATCDHSYYVAGSNRVSRHVSGNAIDFKPGVQRSEILKFLVATHKDGLTMTYGPGSHIHVDIGHHAVILASNDRGVLNGVQPISYTHARASRYTRARQWSDDDDDDWF